MTEENKEIKTEDTADNKNRKITGLKQSLQSIFGVSKRCTIRTIYILFVFLLIFFNTNKVYSFDTIDKGKWIVLDQEMFQPRTWASCRLLPDGNVFIMGSTRFAEIFDTKEQKIIKKIPVDYLRYDNYNSVSLQNGDVYVVGGERQKESVYTKPAAAKFNAKTYKFEDAACPSYNFIYDNLILLDNGHVLMIPSYIQTKDTHQIYNPDKNIYYTAENNNLIPVGRFLFKFKNGDVLFAHIKNRRYIYKYADNKVENYPVIVPFEHISIQIDEDNYLNIIPKSSHSEGYLYNVKTNVKTPVKNKINRTWYVNNPYPPQTILLDNGNVLILGIYAKGESTFARLFYKYSSYIFWFFMLYMF